MEDYTSILPVLTAFGKFDFKWSVLVDEACTSRAECVLAVHCTSRGMVPPTKVNKCLSTVTH